jgi:hypothetical protein
MAPGIRMTNRAFHRNEIRDCPEDIASGNQSGPFTFYFGMRFELGIGLS